MTDFNTTLHGLKCICRVTHYRPHVPGRISGPPEDCYPAEEAEFEYTILNIDGTPAPDVDVSDDDWSRLIDEYEAHITSIKHGMDF